MSNAALSVLNYRRTLYVARTLGFKIHMVDIADHILSTASILLPSTIRQSVFENAKKTKTAHLLWFSSSWKQQNSVARAMVLNLRNLLHKGKGLPLLFTHYELGFSYYNVRFSHNNNGDDENSGCYTPDVTL